ncbi:hypothetical protein [Fuchsiella alkaliacetigena]|uniref:hypothetical protein n=1 Tax=Fuchsiella alkaliacetigena TaxID=957042 RepID=UPI00200B2CFE|nr:hypothetical protein [Fuchsiella alkaliacetigena]MCK8825013.1 hypothetical protein [Fuchsiella alkaliacetigena]
MSTEEINLYLPIELQEFILNLALEEETTPEEIIIEILDAYYQNIGQDYSQLDEGLDILVEK